MNDPDAARRVEFEAYVPEEAAEDARRDIERGTPRLFYFAVYEAPELIAISGDTDPMPYAAHVYLGSGCTDPIHGDDAPPGYRSAMENALRYGDLYNRALAEHFHWPMDDAPTTVPSDTDDFLGGRGEWAKVRIALDDLHPLFGGRAVIVDAAGQALVRSVRGGPDGMREEIYRLGVMREDVERILDACVAQDFVTLTSATHCAPPDHAHPTVTLTNAGGEEHAVTNWDPPVPGGDGESDRRFAAVYRELRRWEMVGQETASPLHEGAWGKRSPWEKLRKKLLT